METNQRKVGRPKATPRTGPLVLGDDRARTKVTFEISERAAAELVEYTRWVEQCSGMPASEARFKTVDFALRETFQRDRVWQAKRRSSVGTASPVSTPTPSSPVRPAVVASSSLPPPAPRDLRTGT
jgi:hypothetical protein